MRAQHQPYKNTPPIVQGAKKQSYAGHFPSIKQEQEGQDIHFYSTLTPLTVHRCQLSA